MMQDDFRANLKAILERRQLSRSELARRMGVTPQYVSNILHLAHDPTLGLVERIAAALEIDPRQLLKKIRQPA